MKFGTLSILFTLTVALGVYIYYGIQKPMERAELEVPEEDRLIQFNWESLQELSLSIPGQKKLEVQFEADRAMIQAPFKDIPSQTKLESLISTLKKLKKEKLILDANEFDESKLEDFQLDEKQALVLQLKARNSENVLEFRFGGSNPSRTGSYALLPQSRQLLLGSKEVDRLRTESPDDYREKRLLTLEKDDFVEVSIQNSTGKMKFVRGDNESWAMTEPKNLPLDQSFTVSQISKIQLLRANRFLDALPTKLKTPDVRILVGFKEGARDARSSTSDPRPSGSEILLYRSAKSSKTAGDEGDQFDYFASSEKAGPLEISRFHFDNFTKSYKDYVKKSFDDFSLSEIKSIKISAKDSQLQIEGEGDQFTWDSDKPLHKSALEKATTNLRQLRAQNFIEETSPPKKADWHIEFVTNKGGKLNFWWSAKNEFWYGHEDKALKYSLRAGSFDPSVWTEAFLSTAPEELAQKEDGESDHDHDHHGHDHHDHHGHEGHLHD